MNVREPSTEFSRRKHSSRPSRRPGLLAATWLLWFATASAVAQDRTETRPGDQGQAVGPAERVPTAAETLFARRIDRLLQDKCFACHGGDPDWLEGSLDLRGPDAAAKGGDSGVPAIVSGRPDESPLYLAMTRTHDDWSAMPPKDAEAVTEGQLRWVRDWIEAGADWPDEQRVAAIRAMSVEEWAAEDGVPMITSGGLSQSWTTRLYDPADLWAYRGVVKPDVPGVGAADIAPSGGPSSHPIDRFLQVAMPPGLSPAPPADRVTLIRRVTYGLIGLPPTPDEIDRFVGDPRPDDTAFAAVVDRLLDSPHYGERMAQHWLDVTRYADSSGLANDFPRGNAWRYRDYVIRAFNDDKPYDRFVREQLAGDELDPNDAEMRVAAGFLRMGPWELTGMEVAKVARQRFLDDVTNAVGETFLAHSLQCARCHDHKFDPIPTRDYYALQAVFATTQLAEPRAAFLGSENVDGFGERRYLEMVREGHEQTLRELDERLLENALAWFAERDADPGDWLATVAQARRGAGGESGGVFRAARNRMLKAGIPESQFPPKLVGLTPRQFGIERVARKGLERLRWEAERYEPFALSVYSGRTPDRRSVVAPTRVPENRLQAGELEQTCILTGGDPFSPGQPVRPGVLSVLGDIAAAPIPETIEGRRVAFADWVASPENPLTTRTIVNRVWLWHFGQALAGNPNNFGATGKRPTHPELLDWLAATLVEDGWSIKRLTRRIVMSEAYRRGGSHPDPETLMRSDPHGTSYARFRPRRLTAEELRDAMLAVSGELNPILGGIPCRPEINPEAALQPRQVMGTFAAAWTAHPDPDRRHRRSIYVLRLRGLPVPMFDVLNQPSPDFSCEHRESSTVTPQVFSLLNSRNSHARGLAFANRVLAESSGDADAIRRCFRLAYARDPRPDESERCLEHWRQIEASLPETATAAVTLPRNVVRQAVEENTGENFTFRERLHAHDDFVRDLQPADVDRRTRALADVCLALLNSNEFVYID